MLITFPKFTDEELKDDNLFGTSDFQIGLVSFTVNKIKLTESKSGNPMLKVNLKLADEAFNVAYCFDYFVLTHKAKWKLRTLFDALNINVSTTELLKSGQFDDIDLLNKEGQCDCTEEEYNGRKSIKVKTYISKDALLPAPESKKDEEPFDDTIPF